MTEKKKFEEEESASTPDISPERNKLAEQHAREHPEGDPAVRRISPDKGTAGGRPVKLHGEEKHENQKKKAS